MVSDLVSCKHRTAYSSVYALAAAATALYARPIKAWLYVRLVDVTRYARHVRLQPLSVCGAKTAKRRTCLTSMSTVSIRLMLLEHGLISNAALHHSKRCIPQTLHPQAFLPLNRCFPGTVAVRLLLCTVPMRYSLGAVPYTVPQALFSLALSSIIAIAPALLPRIASTYCFQIIIPQHRLLRHIRTYRSPRCPKYISIAPDTSLSMYHLLLGFPQVTLVSQHHSQIHQAVLPRHRSQRPP